MRFFSHFVQTFIALSLVGVLLVSISPTNESPVAIRLNLQSSAVMDSWKDDHGSWTPSKFSNHETSGFFVPEERLIQVMTQSYISSSDGPIVIDGNSGFSVFPGSGTIDDPYIIEGYNISNPSGIAIDIRNTDVYFIIRNNTLTFSKDGIFLMNAKNGQIVNNTISGNEQGIYMYNSANNTVSGNSIIENLEGISLWSSPNNTISANMISYNGKDGVLLSDSPWNSISDNIFTDDGIQLFYGTMPDFFVQTVVNNTVNGKPLIFWEGENNKTVPAGAGQVILVNSTDIEITGQNLSNTDLAIQLMLSSFVKVSDNILTDNNIGISVHSSTNITIGNNTVASNDHGIALYRLDSGVIHNNNVIGNGVGISLQESHTNTITANMVSGNSETGILLWDSPRNTITDNILVEDGILFQGTTFEIYFQTTVDNNTVNGNPLIFWVGETNRTVPAGAGQVIIANSSNINVVGQNLSNTDVGLQLISSSFVNVINNTMMNNDMFGIQLYDTFLNFFSNNIIANNSQDGINLFWSTNNLFAGNTITNNTNGMVFLESVLNFIQGNNFIDNGYQVLDYILDNIYNHFKHNYWNDWTSPDADGDGIVDNKYIIQSFNGDPFPHVMPVVNDGAVPEVIIPENRTYEFNTTGNAIVLTVGDRNPGLYNVLLDGELYFPYTFWENGTVSIEIDEVEIGDHIVTVNFYDLTGNWVSETFIITILPPSQSTTTSTSQSQTASSSSATNASSTIHDTSTGSGSTTSNKTPFPFILVNLLIFVVVIRRRYH